MECDNNCMNKGRDRIRHYTVFDLFSENKQPV